METSLLLWLYLGLALLIPGRPLYTVVYFAGGVFLLARLSLEYAMRRIQVERLCSDDRIFIGEHVSVTLRFRNPTGMPIPWLQFAESRPQPLATEPLMGIVTLESGGSATVQYQLMGVKRGRYQIGPLGFAGGDPFGFARFEGQISNRTLVTVYPKISALPVLGLPSRLPMGDLATRRRLFEDPAWLSGTRPYAPGDSMKRIHWSATARTGELVVKQFRHAMLLPCCIAVNLNRDEYEPRQFYAQSELAVDAAASLCQHLVSLKQQVALVATGIDPDAGDATAATGAPAGATPVRLPLRQGQHAMTAVLEVLARIEAGAGVPFARTVVDEAQHLPWGALLCLITPRETPEIAALCTRLAHGGRQVLLFVMDGRSGRRQGYQVWTLTTARSGEVVVG